MMTSVQCDKNLHKKLPPSWLFTAEWWQGQSLQEQT